MTANKKYLSTEIKTDTHKLRTSELLSHLEQEVDCTNRFIQNLPQSLSLSGRTVSERLRQAFIKLETHLHKP